MGIQQKFFLGVTGHRFLGELNTVNYVREETNKILDGLVKMHGNSISVLSGLAEGADSIIAELAVEKNIELIAIIAFKRFIDDFENDCSRQRYQNLISKSAVVEYMPFNDRSDDAYMSVGHWIVDHSNQLVAVWNGKPAAGLGGTADVVEYARHSKVPVLHIHTLSHTTQLID